jgi:hypothetical protein
MVTGTEAQATTLTSTAPSVSSGSAYAYIKSFTRGFECAGDQLSFVTAYAVNQCITYYNGSHYVSRSYDCNTMFYETHYGSTDCNPDTIVDTKTLSLNVCYPYDQYQSYVALCAATIDEIDAVGNFVVEANFNATDSECVGPEPTNFVAFNTQYCFLDMRRVNASFSFGCSYTTGLAKVENYANPFCEHHVTATYFNPFCHAYDVYTGKDKDVPPMLAGYDVTYCTAINATMLYDDDTQDDDYNPSDDDFHGVDDDIFQAYGYSLATGYGGDNCETDTLMSVAGFENNKCIPFTDSGGVVAAVFLCSQDLIQVEEYTSTDCNPSSSAGIFTVSTDRCYYDSSYGSTITYGCASSVYDIPQTGVFVADSLYDLKDSTCEPQDQPMSFTLLSTDHCFPYDQNSSYIFGCSRSHSTSTVRLYDDSYCGHQVATTYLNPLCNPHNTYESDDAINATYNSYEQYFCVALNESIIYDDEFATDDEVRPAGYYYIQYYSGFACNEEPTFSQGIALGKCLLLYNDAALVVGSSLSYCSGQTFTQYTYKSYDCTGDSQIYQYSSVGSCFPEGSPDDDLGGFTGQYGHSYNTMCSSGEDLPVNASSVVLRGYESNSASCDTSVVIYEAITTGFCYADPYTTPVSNSYVYTCDSSHVIETYYNNSASCMGSSGKIYPFSTQCEFYNFGEAMKKAIAQSQPQSPAALIKNPLRDSVQYYYDDYYSGTYYYDDYYNGTYYYFYDGDTTPFDYYQIGCFIVNPTPQPSPQPTVASSPTKAPVAFPTTYPTPSLSTGAPTLSNPVVVSFDQIISGCNYSMYSTNTTAYDLAIKSSIVSSIPGMILSYITSFVVYPPVAASLVRRALAASTSTSLSISYTITSTSSALTADSITSALVNSVDNGLFTDFLNTYAMMYGANGLAHADSTDVSSTGSTSSSSSSSDNGLGDGIIAAIVIMTIVGVVGIGVLVYLIRVRQQAAHAATTRESIQLAPVVTDRSKDANKGDVENPMVSGATFGTVVVPKASAPAPAAGHEETVSPMQAAVTTEGTPAVAAVAIGTPVPAPEPEVKAKAEEPPAALPAPAPEPVAPAAEEPVPEPAIAPEPVATAPEPEPANERSASPTPNRSSSPLPPPSQASATREDVATYGADDRVQMETNPMRRKKDKK